jgi:serine protease inhibitor
MPMTRSFRPSWCVPLLLVAGCNDIVAPDPAPEFQRVQLDAEVVHAYTGFGFDLFAAVRGEAPRENLFLSPTSAAFALAMTYNGAAGETRQAMARTLGVAQLSRDQLNAANRQWLAALRDTQDPRVDLALANSIWARQGFPFRESFYERNRQYYDAEVRELPFDDAALRTINAWVDRSTRGKIDRILDQITGDDVMFLINALYFKGQWRYRFNEQETRPGPFTRPDGTRAEVPMMNQRAELPYLRADGFQMVSLPYGNGRFSMVLALPDHGRSLADFYAALTPGSWAQWNAAMRTREVGVVLPRFRMESDRQLRDALSGMGMEIAFDPVGADFSEMTPAQVFIAFVRQKTFVEVNEEGTEAAAVTVVGMQRVCGGCGPEYPVLQFDRPFFFAIQDHATNTVLFLGQMMDPSAG